MMNTKQREMRNRLIRMYEDLKDARRAAYERRRQKAERLIEAQLELAKAENRVAEIKHDYRTLMGVSEAGSRYLAEANETLADARNVVADLQADIAHLDELHAQATEDFATAEKAVKIFKRIFPAGREVDMARYSSPVSRSAA
jgi:chromosome segregation ATPase